MLEKASAVENVTEIGHSDSLNHLGMVYLAENMVVAAFYINIRRLLGTISSYMQICRSLRWISVVTILSLETLRAN